MFRTLFFEDDPARSENQLFRMTLRRQLKEAGCKSFQILERQSVSQFEHAIRNIKFNVIVLDIMAKPVEPLLKVGTREIVPENMTGIELLRRCRYGVYGTRYQLTKLPIFIRSARGEQYIRRECEHEKCSGVFWAGKDDELLNKKISDAYRAWADETQVHI